MDATDVAVLRSAQDYLNEVLLQGSPETLPDQNTLVTASKALYIRIPDDGKGLTATSTHILRDVLPGLNASSLSPNYYGFVTGGVTPAARLGESVVSMFDQNVSVHLPDETVATVVEDRALSMLLELVELSPDEWPARTFTTGATASNVLGMACGRDFVIAQRLSSKGLEYRQGEGVLASCLRAGIRKLQVLTTMPHSSLGKAATIVGLGSDSVVDVSSDSHFLNFDLAKLERDLAIPDAVSVVAISCGEVNTGLFATLSYEEVKAIRELCDRYGAWLHVDAAFGLFARVLPRLPAYEAVRAGAAGLELADSIGGDGHKLLNVPYDCGFFFSRHREPQMRVFQNTNAAYLDSSATDGIVSPLNIRLENSARFRGLPVYATLISYGREGYTAMVARMVELARKIAVFIRDECAQFELLPADAHSRDVDSVYMCVLFRARDEGLNAVLTAKIKATRKIYVSGTQWEGKAAVRFAIAKWDVDVERDFATVAEVLHSITHG